MENKNVLIVNYDEYLTGRGDPTSYTDDDRYSFQINEVYSGKQKNVLFEEPITVDFEADKADKVYVVYGIYSTGNSFGTSYGHGHIVGIYDNITKAEQVETLINKIYKEYSDRSEISKKLIKEWCSITNTPVKEFSVYRVGPWHGYFETLETTVIKKCKVHHINETTPETI
jgi:hypothetical protein